MAAREAHILEPSVVMAVSMSGSGFSSDTGKLSLISSRRWQATREAISKLQLSTRWVPIKQIQESNKPVGNADRVDALVQQCLGLLQQRTSKY